MKRKMYYKTKWGGNHSPFICELSGKLHFPEVEVWVETPAGSEEIPYKEIDTLMYQISKSTFEGLAEGIAQGVAKKIQVEGKQVSTKVTVTVRDPGDPDFWVEVEAVGQKET